MVFPLLYRTSRCRAGLLIACCLLLTAVISSCKKNQPFAGIPATCQVFNAMDDGIVLLAHWDTTRPAPFSFLRRINNKANYAVTTGLYSTLNGSQPLQLFAFPDTLSHQGPLVDTRLQLEEGGLYSLFISGSNAAPQYVLHKDEIPVFNQEDSTTHIRFANFSDGQTISVNLKGEAPGSFIQNLPPKGFSVFREMSARKSVIRYEFEIRDQANGNLITTYTADKFDGLGGTSFTTRWYNRANTLVLTGKQGGTGTNLQVVYLMNNR
ncbi:MAG: hypothetical protein ACTHMC_27115 [Pseudobacter sp.]|uniref:hypothetical protein n=1 Tax=Pseudobacter sp. TaxID=2045420 RepID=UPI003F7CF4A5